jgi:hypothetical protein
VIEVVKQLAALPSDPAAAVAVRSLLGESEQGTSADQIAWAFRKLLVEQAPLVVIFDDIQWGEETFLDLVEAAALLTGDAPILLLCMARPEPLERHPAWPGTLRLEPLSDDEADQLIREEVTGELHERIAHAAGAPAARPCSACGRRRFSLPPPLDPRRGLRFAAKERSGGAPRALCRLARLARGAR